AAALGWIKLAAKAAVPALVEALKDEGADVRRAAASALLSIGADARDDVPVLGVALKAAVPAFVEALKD
ncbi:HEAT repeat domain-containing protein, partial [candidate division KSB1 bacterium]|nr:HEAT repeat domain-containing protein [candidate division KSB1 bacterium]